MAPVELACSFRWPLLFSLCLFYSHFFSVSVFRRVCERLGLWSLSVLYSMGSGFDLGVLCLDIMGLIFSGSLPLNILVILLLDPCACGGEIRNCETRKSVFFLGIYVTFEFSPFFFCEEVFSVPFPFSPIYECSSSVAPLLMHGLIRISPPSSPGCSHVCIPATHPCTTVHESVLGTRSRCSRWSSSSKV